MKYNPRVNEAAARLDGFAGLHPYQPEALVQGALELMYDLERWLAEIAGLHATTLQPAAGAHGELTGLLVIRAAHLAEGRDPKRIIIPDTAHGTNPASVIMAGFEPAAVRSDARGGVDMDALREVIAGGDIAGLMLTNPNTLGLFDENITEIAAPRPRGRRPAVLRRRQRQRRARHQPARRHGLRHRPLQPAQDVQHAARRRRPGRRARSWSATRWRRSCRCRWSVKGEDGRFFLEYDRPQSIGKVRTFYGNFGVLVRAYTYIRGLGAEGLREVSEMAVLNANYVMEGVARPARPALRRPPLHARVRRLGDACSREHGVRALDVAKRLLDYGVHPPTTYFPLIVDEALMVEPTETESKDALDRMIEAFRHRRRGGQGPARSCCTRRR